MKSTYIIGEIGQNHNGSVDIAKLIVDLVSRPVKELKGFQRISLKRGETKTVTFTITPDDLKFYNQNLDYKFEPGDFDVMIGSSSDDIKTLRFTLD
jgi:beta-glucosidase